MLAVSERPILTILRLEGAVAFIAGLAAYFSLTDGWHMLALLILAPDLAMLGYLIGPKAGARAYNLAHTYIAPALLAALGLWAYPSLLPVAAIWVAHIGFDRALGYGLKSETMFGLTHLGRIGKSRPLKNA